MLLTATYEVFMGACNKKRWVLRYRGDISLNSSPERGTPIGKRKQEILTGCPENFLIFLLQEVSKVLNWPAAVANIFPWTISTRRIPAQMALARSPRCHCLFFLTEAFSKQRKIHIF